MLTAGKAINKQGGYAYLMLMLTVASICLLASILGAVSYVRASRIDKERELIFRGLAYKEGIKSYYISANKREYPKQLRDLINDPRFSNKKHIRKLYNDPITSGKWTLIINDRGEITGVSSASKLKPIKQHGFPDNLKEFDGALHYSDWIFINKK